MTAETRYYRNWLATPEQAKAVTLPRDAIVADAVNDQTDVVMMHIPFNTVADRGRPLVTRSMPWAKAYKDVLQDYAAWVKSKATFTREMTVKGSSRAVDAISRKFASTLMTGDTESNPAYAAGSTLTHNEAVSMRDIPMSTGAGDFSASSMLFVSMAGLGSGTPPSYLGRPDAMQNRATAKSLELPVLRQWQLYQVLWKSVWRDIVKLVLKASGDYGHKSFENYDATVTMDSPLEAALSEVMSALGIAYDKKLITPRRAAQVALRQPEFGIDDPEAALEELEAEWAKASPAESPSPTESPAPTTSPEKPEEPAEPGENPLPPSEEQPAQERASVASQVVEMLVDLERESQAGDDPRTQEQLAQALHDIVAGNDHGK